MKIVNESDRIVELKFFREGYELGSAFLVPKDKQVVDYKNCDEIVIL